MWSNHVLPDEAVSHMPAYQCATEGHVWTAWTSTEATMPSGEPGYVLERTCCSCGLVDRENAAVKDDNP